MSDKAIENLSVGFCMTATIWACAWMIVRCVQANRREGK